MTHEPVHIICRDCGNHGVHSGRGLCHDCYRQHRADGTLNQWPSVRGDREWQAAHRLTPTRPTPPPQHTLTLRLGPGERWEDKAACRHHDPELWFPLGDGSDNPAVQEAIAICQGCPVLAACAAWVDANPQDHGIWAATTPRQRRRNRARNVERSTA